MKNTFFLLFLLICISCSDSPEPDFIKGGALKHGTQNRMGLELPEEFNDPFRLDTVYIRGTELWAEVSYSGGCGEHDFLVAWPEAIIMIYPYQFGITLHHNANGDLCEAYIHQTLKIDLTDTQVGGFDPASIAEMHLTVVNGSNPEETKSTWQAGK